MPNGCARCRTLNPNARCDCRGYSTIRFRNEVTHGLDHRNRRKDRHDVITDIAEFSSVAAAAAIGLVLMFVGGVGFHSRGYAFLCAADAPCLRNLLADCPSDQLRNRTSLGAGVIRTPSLARPAAARCARRPRRYTDRLGSAVNYGTAWRRLQRSAYGLLWHAFAARGSR